MNEVTPAMLRAHAQCLLADARILGEACGCDGSGCTMLGVMILVERAEQQLSKALIAERPGG